MLRLYLWLFSIAIIFDWFTCHLSFAHILQIKYSQRGTIVDGIGANADDYEHWLRFHKPIRPENQLDLTDAELAEEITKHLDTEHKNLPKNLVVYSFKDYAYVPVWCFTNKLNIWDVCFLIFIQLQKSDLKLSPPPNVGVLVDIPSNSVLIEGDDGNKIAEDTTAAGILKLLQKNSFLYIKFCQTQPQCITQMEEQFFLY